MTNGPWRRRAASAILIPMASRTVRLALRHRGLITGTLLAFLLFNLLGVGLLRPSEARSGDLPLAASCQGSGPGCAEQPLIPPPAGGLPHFEPPPAPVFGRLVRVQPAAPAAVDESPPVTIEPPPRAAFA